MAKRYRISMYQTVSITGYKKWCFWKSVSTENEYKNEIAKQEAYGCRVRVIDRKTKKIIYETP